MHLKKVDTIFLWITLAIVLGGFFLFFSASFGVISRNDGDFGRTLSKQLFLALIPGLVAMFVFSRMNPKIFRKLSFFAFLGAILANLLVFVPGIGFEHGGARRWIDVGFTTFQPSEILKISFVLYFAAWLAAAKDKVRTFKFGTLPFLCLLAIPCGILILQKDMGTLGIVAAAGGSMFLVAGGKWSHIFAMVFLAVGGFFALLQVDNVFKIYHYSYLEHRIDTFLHPEKDLQGAGFQINQSQIAIGAGGLFGRGYGKGLQKYSLPEPTSDSIFSAASEEFGFIGSTIIVLLFLLFAMRGFHIASASGDRWSRLTVTGIIILIITQSYINIASMLGLFPVTGVPLVFVSSGGSALLFNLAEMGIVLAISRGIGEGKRAVSPPELRKKL